MRDADGTLPARSTGRSSSRDGTVRHLDRDAFTVEVTDRWTSPATGADYPAGWTIRIPGEDLAIDAAADGRRPGARHARDDRRRLLGGLAGRSGRRRAGTPLGGEGYVELTGYAGARPTQPLLPTPAITLVKPGDTDPIR